MKKAEEKTKMMTVGGQAVVEGVMMRSPHFYSIASLKEDGSIKVTLKEKHALGIKYKVFALPFVRGVASLFEMMTIGIKSLMISAEEFAEEDIIDNNKNSKKDKIKDTKPDNEVESNDESIEESEKKIEEDKEFDTKDAKTDSSKEVKQEKEEKHSSDDEKISKGTFDIMMIGTVVVSFLIAMLLFMALPYGLSLGLFHFTSLTEENNPVIFNLLDGVIKMLIFLAYLLLIARMEDVKRIFAFHGAEHKAVNCYEDCKSIDSLDVRTAKTYSRIHKRCGTTFIFIVILIGVVFLSLVPIGFNWIMNVFNLAFVDFLFIKAEIWRKVAMFLTRLLFLFPIASVSYEILRLGNNSNSFLVKMFTKPGLALQKITTNPPDEKQVEVGVEALRSVLEAEEKFKVTNK